MRSCASCRCAAMASRAAPEARATMAWRCGRGDRSWRGPGASGRRGRSSAGPPRAAQRRSAPVAGCLTSRRLTRRGTRCCLCSCLPGTPRIGLANLRLAFPAPAPVPAPAAFSAPRSARAKRARRRAQRPLPRASGAARSSPRGRPVRALDQRSEFLAALRRLVDGRAARAAARGAALIDRRPGRRPGGRGAAASDRRDARGEPGSRGSLRLGL